MSLAKIIGTTLMVLGGFGAFTGYAGWISAGLTAYSQNKKIERLEELQKYFIDPKNSPTQYDSVLQEIQQLRGLRTNNQTFGIEAFGLALVSSCAVLGGIKLIEIGEGRK